MINKLIMRGPLTGGPLKFPRARSHRQGPGRLLCTRAYARAINNNRNNNNENNDNNDNNNNHNNHDNDNNDDNDNNTNSNSNINDNDNNSISRKLQYNDYSKDLIYNYDSRHTITYLAAVRVGSGAAAAQE